MKTNKLLLSALIFFLACVPLFQGCELFENEELDPIGDYLVDYKKVMSYSLDDINVMFDLLGTVEPDAAQLTDDLKYATEVYRIRYMTTYKGQEVMASGLISIPVNEGGSFPLVSFQNGTNVEYAKAPSEDLDNINYGFLHISAGFGFIMAMPDYIGFGESKKYFHPYLHNETTCDAVIDMIHATEEFINHKKKILWNQRLYLMGYSQGGWATMTVHKKIESDNSVPYSVTASAAGAGPYHLNHIMDYMLAQETYPQPYFMAYVIEAYRTLGILTQPLSEFFKTPYSERIPELFDFETTGEQINSQFTTDVSELVTPQFLEGFEDAPAFTSLRTLFDNNSVEAWDADAPIRLFHGTADVYIPPSTSDNFYADLITAGNTTDEVKLVPIPDKDHVSGIIPAMLSSVTWFIDLENTQK